METTVAVAEPVTQAIERISVDVDALLMRVPPEVQKCLQRASKWMELARQEQGLVESREQPRTLMAAVAILRDP